MDAALAAESTDAAAPAGVAFWSGLVERARELDVATAVLVAIPGPNVALIVANSLGYGLRMGVMTVIGTTAGLALQLALVGVGMVALIEHAAAAMTWIRWLGVVYLVYLGVRTWRAPPEELVHVQAAPAM